MPVAATNTMMIIAIASMAVIAWLFCAFTVAAFARDNGKSYNLWLLLGFLTGPLGLLFGYLYFRVTGERYRQNRFSEGGKSGMPEMIHCPNCNQSVPRSFENCQFCGAPLHSRKRR